MVTFPLDRMGVRNALSRRLTKYNNLVVGFMQCQNSPMRSLYLPFKQLAPESRIDSQAPSIHRVGNRTISAPGWRVNLLIISYFRQFSDPMGKPPWEPPTISKGQVLLILLLLNLSCQSFCFILFQSSPQVHPCRRAFTYPWRRRRRKEREREEE